MAKGKAVKFVPPNYIYVRKITSITAAMQMGDCGEREVRTRHGAGITMPPPKVPTLQRWDGQRNSTLQMLRQ